MNRCPVGHDLKWIATKTMFARTFRGELTKVHPGQCLECFRLNNHTSVGKAHPKLGDKPLRADHDAGYTVTRKPDGTITAEAMEAFIRRLAKDEVRVGELEVAARRPSGVSKERFGIAVRSASRIPMLNADRDAIEMGLDHSRNGEVLKKRYVPKGGVIDRMVIKPSTLHNAKYGRNSAWWGERLWTIHSLRYGKGYIVTTDIGDDSKVFDSVGALRSAIKKSGWEIIR